MTPEQCRAARAWLQWKQPVLAERAGVCVETIKRFERRERESAKTIGKIKTAIEAAGVVLVFRNGVASGIEIRPA